MHLYKYFSYPKWLILLLLATPWGLSAQTPGAFYDVIIMQNGKIITGKVLEVNLSTLKYQRLDMPDGPVMEIPRNLVYAITYRNQLTEYLLPADSTTFYQAPSQEEVVRARDWNDRWYADLDSGRLQAGFGFVRSFTMIKNVESLSSRGGSMAFFLGYSFPVRRNIEVGLLAGMASFKYRENRVSEYDEFQVIRDIKENIFSLAATGIYRFGLQRFDPYLLGGLIFYSSRANSDGKIQFFNDSPTITVQNSAAGSSFGILIRAGVSVQINSKTGAYLDLGNGITLLQAGGFIKLDLK